MSRPRTRTCRARIRYDATRTGSDGRGLLLHLGTDHHELAMPSQSHSAPGADTLIADDQPREQRRATRNRAPALSKALRMIQIRAVLQAALGRLDDHRASRTGDTGSKALRREGMERLPWSDRATHVFNSAIGSERYVLGCAHRLTAQRAGDFSAAAVTLTLTFGFPKMMTRHVEANDARECRVSERIGFLARRDKFITAIAGLPVCDRDNDPLVGRRYGENAARDSAPNAFGSPYGRGLRNRGMGLEVMASLEGRLPVVPAHEREFLRVKELTNDDTDEVRFAVIYPFTEV